MKENNAVETNKKQWIFINALKFFAILLVLNSHFDKVYPISALATGGAIGNGLFFIIMGYCTYNIKGNFAKWYSQKIVRLFIPVFIVSVVMMFIDGIANMTLVGAVKMFIWPTGFWFYGALIIFYVVYYIVVKKKLLDKFWILTIVFAVAYFAYYILLLDKSSFVVEASGLGNINGNFKMIYYCYIMLLGAYLRHKNVLEKAANRWLMFVLAGGSFVAMYAVKLLAGRYPVLYNVQFLEQMCVIVFSVSMFLFVSTLEQLISKYGTVSKWIQKLSNYSFEVYVLQFMFIDLFCEMMFPVNMLLILLCIVVASIILKKISEVLVGCIYK